MRRKIILLSAMAFWLFQSSGRAEESAIVLRPPPAAPPAAAANTNASSPAPAVQSNEITVTANQGIEWNRGLRVYTARGAAVIRNGDSTIAANEIKIFYEPARSKKANATASPVFTRIESNGNTVIDQRGNRLTGEKSIIYLDSLETLVTGKGLSLTTLGGEVVTASESLEYREVTQLAVARGSAKAVQGQRTMAADIITASLAPSSQQRQFTRINGFGKVRITSPNQAAAGDRASFDLVKNLAVLSGNVKLGQGVNILAGDYGEMDMNSGVTRILMGNEASSASQKLRGVIVPHDLRSKSPTEPPVRAK